MAAWIASYLFVQVALQWLSATEASHFRYGTISWSPTDSFNDTIRFTFRLAFRRSFSSSYYCDQSTIASGSLLGSGDSWRAKCVNYTGYASQCNSATIGNTGFRCTDYSSSEDWSMGENNFTHTFSSFYKEWVVSYTSCCWISLSRRSYGSWLVSTTVNLTRRSDNGRINSSPVSRSPAIIRWHEGCPQSLRIPVEDADGDVVKCRLASYSESYVYTDSFPYGALDEKMCLLTYNGQNGTTGTYAVALTLEDFPAGTTNFGSIEPFSAVGLQFLVKISSHSGSCGNVPVFTPSTPQDGICTEVQIGSSYKTVIEVTLADFSKHIVEIVTSSPPGMQLTSLRYHRGVYYSNVTWHPSQYQVGQQTFCFKAVDSDGMGSEWRCVTILVGISSTPQVVWGSQTPQSPLSNRGAGYTRWSIQFDRVIKKPRTSSYIRLVLLPSGHTVHKVDTRSQYVIINSDRTTLQFTMPYAALSMNGSYAILMDRGAVVGQGCSYDGPPTPGITNTSDWQFAAGVCPVGYTLAPPDFSSCVDMNECGSPSRSKRSFYQYLPWWRYTDSMSWSNQSPTYAITPTTSSSYVSFTASFPGSCSHHIYGSTYYYKDLHSPGYPGCYPNNEMCTWLIEARVGYYVHLQFYKLSLQYGGSNCPNDFLEIRDGNTLSSPLITKTCGSVGYFDIYSNTRFLILRFYSDGSVQGAGFVAYYISASNRNNNQLPSQHVSSSSFVTCVQTQSHMTRISTTSPITPTKSSFYVPFTASFPGSCSHHVYSSYYYYKGLHSPDYPGCYPNNKVCIWLIEAPVGYHVHFYFNEFSLEYGGSNCPYDFLEIRDGSKLSSPLMTKICGALGYSSTYSSGRFLILRFQSDGIVQGSGFAGYYGSVRQRYNNWIPSPHVSSSGFVTCVSSQTQVTRISTTSLITPTKSFSYIPSTISLSECFSHGYLDDSVRAQGFYNGYYGYYQCDRYLPFGWYRFRGAAGTQMATNCVGKNRCSSHAPGWLSTQHPSVNDGIINGTVCFHWNYGCCHWSTNIRIRNCGGFYVYELGPTPACYLRYCGNGGANNTNSSSNGSIATQAITPTVSMSGPLPVYASQIAPAPSSGYYAPVTSYALPAPVDFQFHVPADCEQICTNTPGSYSCSCVSGYRLSSDGKSCSDIDECSTSNGGCSHRCYNIPGSFYCGCPEGTTMASSNLTCVEPGVSVGCDENNMTISLDKQTFPFFNVNSLHLRYSSCRATQNSTHVIISTPLNSCGTVVNETEDALIFWNEVRADTVIIDNVITRTHDIKFKFYCSYSRKKMLSVQFKPKQMFIGSEAGYGNFTFRMDFYKTSAYATRYTENDYPIPVKLNEYLYVKYSVESSAELVIMAETCKATKYGNFYSWPQYSIIQNGCKRDTTMEYTYNPSGSSQHFKLRAFRFFNDYGVVYLHCELLACYRYSSNSRCSRSCLSSKRRRRRGTIEEEIEHEESTSRHILSSGPIKITEMEEREKEDTGNKQRAALIAAAAAGGGFALIAIIALAILAIKYRLARRFIHRNKVGDLYTTQDEQMSRRNAYIQEDDNMIERENSF